MTTPLRKPPRPAIVFLVECFRVRAEAKAQLWAAGEITLVDGVDDLWAGAQRDGLVRALGTNKVQELLSAPFAERRRRQIRKLRS
jgi:hypothetical protein